MKKRIDTDKFIEMYELGYPHWMICDELDICASTLIKKIEQLGLPRRREPLVIDIEAFQTAYYSGLSSRQLAKKFGICQGTVMRLVRELKLRENHNAMHRMECYAKI